MAPRPDDTDMVPIRLIASIALSTIVASCTADSVDSSGLSSQATETADQSITEPLQDVASAPQPMADDVAASIPDLPLSLIHISEPTRPY